MLLPRTETRLGVGYEVTVVRDRAEFQSVLPEWREFLANKPHGQHFFNDPDIVDFDVRCGGPTPHIVMIRQAGELKCVAPFWIRPSRFRLQFSVFQLASFPVSLMTLCGGNIVYSRTADVAECLSRVFESMQQAQFDLCFLNGIDIQSRLWEYCARGNAGKSRLHFARPSRITDKAFRLEMPESFDGYLAGLGSNTRGSLRRRTRKLIADHSAKLVRISSPDQVRSFLDDANAIFSDSWQAKTFGPVTKNHETEIARLEHVASRGWLHCYLLASDAGPLAFQVGYMYGDTFYACDFAFAQRWSALGAGAVLMYWMLEDLYRGRTPKIVDLGAGDSPQKRTFRGLPRDVGNYYVTPHNRWQHLVTLQQGLSAFESVGRAMLVRMGLDSRVRRFLKHKR